MSRVAFIHFASALGSILPPVRGLDARATENSRHWFMKSIYIVGNALIRTLYLRLPSPATALSASRQIDTALSKNAASQTEAPVSSNTESVPPFFERLS